MRKKIRVLMIGITVIFLIGIDLYQAEELKDYSTGTILLYREYGSSVVFVPLVPSPPERQLLPGYYDWGRTGNNYLGRDICGPIRDQRTCGSCWAFGVVACFEAWVNGLYGYYWIDLSEEVLVSDCCQAGDCGGGYIWKASDWMVNVGTTTEDCWPYTAENGPCSGYCPAPILGRTEYWEYACENWWTIDINLIKEALVYHGPLVTGMDVYSDFMGYSGGVYQHQSGGYQGGHAILITGYVDDPIYPGGGYFIAKNSWGTGWGEEGYFRIAYDSNCEFGIESTYFNGVIVYQP